MSPRPEIHRATIDDIPAIAPLFADYRVFYGRPYDLALAEKFLSDRLGAEESVIYLCRADGEPAGFVQLYPCFSSISAGRKWLLNDLYVRPASRRLGIARLLIEAAHGHARKTGVPRVALSTAHTNLSAQGLYESMGYILDTEFRSYSIDLPPA